ncbi:MAG: TlpA family protein disulfide reductase [Flavobacteriaceae bacterium]|nr:TlpA family protein disulfide reductase [Flavobacteriaceae bacterium]
MNLKKIFFAVIFWISLTGLVSASCVSFHKGKLQDGIWRAELSVFKGKKVPFLFEVKNANTDSAVLTLINGEERVPLKGIYYHSDTVFIPIESYDATIKARISGDNLEGSFIRNYIKNDPGIPFKAERKNAPRFELPANPTQISIEGKWDVFFIGEKNDTIRNVGNFASKNKIVTGSILTNYGDLRFLEGTVTEKGVQLSAFSGLSPYLIEINFTDGDSFEGIFYTARGQTKLHGKRNYNASLDDAYSIAKLKKGFDRLHFQLPNFEGKIISLDDERYRNKVVIVSILGSWCPNCLDEIEYLSPWYKENKDRGVEIIGLAFERKNDFNYAKTAIDRLKKNYGIDYEIVFAGRANAESIARSLPEIENFSSYPTTIFIDKKGKVRKIHTGFSGPATGAFFDEFKKEFNDLIDSLVNEVL